MQPQSIFIAIDKSLHDSEIRWPVLPGISWVINCSVKDKVGIFDSILEQLFFRCAVLTNDVIVTYHLSRDTNFLGLISDY